MIDLTLQSEDPCLNEGGTGGISGSGQAGPVGQTTSGYKAHFLSPLAPIAAAATIPPKPLVKASNPGLVINTLLLAFLSRGILGKERGFCYRK